MIRRVRHGFMATQLRAPTRDITGPMCLTCLKPVDKEELVEGYGMDEHGRESQHDYAKVLITCHGAEELVRFDFDTRQWDHTDLKRALSRHRFFDPMGHKDDDKLSVAT